MQLRDQWNLEMALRVLASDTVDSRSWADAVKWLLFFGPTEIKEILLAASSDAMAKQFPAIEPCGYDAHGAPCYDLEQLAGILDGDEEQLRQALEDAEEEVGNVQLLVDDDPYSVQ